jgi:hypothetical protein
MPDSHPGVSLHFIDDAQGFFLSLSQSWSHMIDQTNLQSVFSFDSSASKDKLFGQRNSDGPRESLSSTSSGDETPICFWKTHFRLESCDSDISIQGQFETSPKCWAIDEAENRALYISDLIEDPSEIGDDIFEFIISLVQPFFQVCSSTKMAFDAATYDASPERRLLIDIFDGGVELIEGGGT